jgi:hypothetical protein
MLSVNLVLEQQKKPSKTRSTSKNGKYRQQIKVIVIIVFDDGPDELLDGCKCLPRLVDISPKGSFIFVCIANEKTPTARNKTIVFAPVE